MLEAVAEPDYASPDRRICRGATAQLGSPARPGYSYQWAPSAGLDRTDTSAPTFSGTATSQYIVSVTSPFSPCTVRLDTVVVTVVPPPDIAMPRDTAICAGDQFQLNPSSVAGTQFSWQPATGLSNPNIRNPIASPTYGWSDLAPQLAAHADAAQKAVAEETVLVRLVALNAERAAEEAKCHIRWLRPDYQHPSAQPRQADMVLDDGRQDALPGETSSALVVQRLPWPVTLPAQVAAVARLLDASPLPLAEGELAARFTGKGSWEKRLPQIVDTLEALGRVRRQGARVAGVGEVSGAL